MAIVSIKSQQVTLYDVAGLRGAGIELHHGTRDAGLRFAVLDRYWYIGKCSTR